MDAQIKDNIENTTTLSVKAIAELKAHREEVREHFKFVWSEYLKWFTFFCTFNLTALVVVHSVGTDPGLSPLVCAFLAIDVLSSVSSVYMFYYSGRVCLHLNKLAEELCESAVEPPEKLIVRSRMMPTFPMALSKWAAAANFLAIVILIAVWTVISVLGITKK